MEFCSGVWDGPPKFRGKYHIPLRPTLAVTLRPVPYFNFFDVQCTHVKTHSLFLPVDSLERGWAGQLEHGCWQVCSCMLEQTVHTCGWMNEQTWTTLLINQQPCSSYIIEHAVREWWNNKIEQRCHNNDEFGRCIKSSFACSNIHE